MLREILSPGRAKLVELQGAVERLEDLMRRYTQRRDARNGQRHTLAEDIRMAALEALLPNSSHTANTVGHVPEVERRSCSLRRSKRVRCTQAGSSVEGSRRQRRSYGCWRIRTMERTNLFQRKGKESHWHWQRKGNSKRWCEIIRKFTAGQGHSSRVKDSQILLEREMM